MSALMASGNLPPPQSSPAFTARRTEFRTEMVDPYTPLDALGESLKKLGDMQRRYFKNACVKDDELPDPDAPPEFGEDEPRGEPDRSSPRPAPIGYFASSDRWRRPSDYVAYLAREFEAGRTGPLEEQGKRKRLKRDQTLFLAQFAEACNCVWDDEDAEIAYEKRRRYNMLLMGEGGTGKTAIVQEIVLPAIDFIFGAEDD